MSKDQEIPRAPEPGRHLADQAAETHEADLARATATGVTRGDGPGKQAMAAFRAQPDRHDGDLGRKIGE